MSLGLLGTHLANSIPKRYGKCLCNEFWGFIASIKHQGSENIAALFEHSERAVWILTPFLEEEENISEWAVALNKEGHKYTCSSIIDCGLDVLNMAIKRVFTKVWLSMSLHLKYLGD